METIQISDRFTVAMGQPDTATLRDLADEGFGTVVNLRAGGEDDEQLDPDRERDMARSLGLDYVHLPVTQDRLGPELVDRFRGEVSDCRSPVLVHCASGKRSGAMTMLHVGVERGMSGQEIVDEANQMGFQCDSEDLVELVKSYADSRTQGRAQV